MIAAQPPVAALVARHRPVEGEAHSVEHTRLAGARAAGDEEDAVVREGVEVDDLPLAERPEALELEPDGASRGRLGESAVADEVTDDIEFGGSGSLACPHMAEEGIEELDVALRFAHARHVRAAVVDARRLRERA